LYRRWFRLHAPLLLAALFATQFAFTNTSVRIGYAVVYCALSPAVLVTDIPRLRPFARAAYEGLTRARTRLWPARHSAAGVE
jgi:hypothetical protein